MSPLAGLDLPTLYDRYHASIDFMIFLPLLIAISKASLSRAFPDHTGERLGTVVGVVLAVSLSVTEHFIGFSLKSFGPIAAGLIALLVSMVVYNMLRHAGAGHATCSSLSLIVTYLSMRVAVPGFFLWAQQNEWANYLHALVVLAVIVALWHFVRELFTPKETGAIKKALKHVVGDNGGFIDISRKRQISEWDLAKRHLQKLTIKGGKESTKIIQVLEQLLSTLKEYGADKRIADPICKALGDLKTREHELLLQLSKIRKTDTKLMRYDLSQFQSLKKNYDMLNSEQQRELKRMFMEERSKLGIEQKIKDLTEGGEQYCREFERAVDGACTYIRNGNAYQAAEWIGKAIDVEKRAAKMLEDMQELDRTLIHIVKNQISALKSTKNS